MKVIINSLPKSRIHLLGKFMDSLGFGEVKPGLTGALVRESDGNPYQNWLKRNGIRVRRSQVCGSILMCRRIVSTEIGLAVI